MTLQEPERVRFHNWLIENDLDADVADAILSSMPPYSWHDLATKTDIANLGQRLDRTENSIQDVRTDLTNQIGQLRTDMTGEIGQLRTDMGSLGTDMTGQIGQLRTDMGSLRTDMTKQLIGLRHEIRIVLLAIVGFMLSLLLALNSGSIG